MKLYKFFRNSDRLKILDMKIQEKYPLYAVTTDKKDAKRFETSREPGSFIKRVSYVDSEGATEFINTHRGNYLEWNVLTTKKKNDNGTIDIYTVKVLMTDSELELLRCSINEYEPFTEGVSIDPGIFKQKYLYCLSTLGYIAAYVVNSNKVSDKFPVDDEYYYLDNLIFDELAIYIKMISDQINPSKFDAIIKKHKLKNEVEDINYEW